MANLDVKTIAIFKLNFVTANQDKEPTDNKMSVSNNNHGRNRTHLKF